MLVGMCVLEALLREEGEKLWIRRMKREKLREEKRTWRWERKLESRLLHTHTHRWIDMYLVVCPNVLFD